MRIAISCGHIPSRLDKEDYEAMGLAVEPYVKNSAILTYAKERVNG